MALDRHPSAGRGDRRAPFVRRTHLPAQVSMRTSVNSPGGAAAPLGTDPLGTGPVGAAESDPARTCTELATLRVPGTAPAAVTKAWPSGKHAAKAVLRLSSNSENTSSKSNTGLEPS